MSTNQAGIEKSQGTTQRSSGNAVKVSHLNWSVVGTCVALIVVSVTVTVLLSYFLFANNVEQHKKVVEECQQVSSPTEENGSIIIDETDLIVYGAQVDNSGRVFLINNHTSSRKLYVYTGSSSLSEITTPLGGVNGVGYGRFNFAVSRNGKSLVAGNTQTMKYWAFTETSTPLIYGNEELALHGLDQTTLVHREGVSISDDGSTIAIAGSFYSNDGFEYTDSLGIFVNFYRREDSASPYIPEGIIVKKIPGGGMTGNVISLALSDDGQHCALAFSYSSQIGVLEEKTASLVIVKRYWGGYWGESGSTVIKVPPEQPHFIPNTTSILVRNSLSLSSLTFILSQPSYSVRFYDAKPDGTGFINSFTFNDTSTGFGSDISTTGVNCIGSLYIGSPGSNEGIGTVRIVNGEDLNAFPTFLPLQKPSSISSPKAFGGNVSVTSTGSHLIVTGTSSNGSQTFISTWVP